MKKKDSQRLPGTNTVVKLQENFVKKPFLICKLFHRNLRCYISHKGDFGGENLCQTGSVVFALCKKEKKNELFTPKP